MSAIKQLKEQIVKLRRQTAELRSNVETCFMTTGTTVTTTQLHEFADILSYLAYATKNTIQNISTSFQTAHKQLTDAEKKALWALLFEYCKLLDKSISHLQQTVGNDYSISGKINTSKQNLEVINELILAMEFKPTHIYRSEYTPVDVSSSLFNRMKANHKETTKPSFISKLITKLCVKAVTNIEETEEAIASNLKSTLLSAPNDVSNYQLRIDKSTIVQTIEYLNPNATNKWLIVVGGAGASYTNMLPVAKEIATQGGYNFLIVDYLADKPTSFSDPVKIILAATQFLLEKRGVKAKDLVLVGHSNGGRIVSEAGSFLPDCRVITNNTYTSLEEVIINNVLHGVEFLKNAGISVNKYSAEIINAVTDFLKQHHLDEKILHILRNALEQTNNGYQAEQVKMKIADHHFAAVYTESALVHDSSGQKLPKAGRDRLLFEASDGVVQAQKAKQQSLEQRRLLKKKNGLFHSYNNASENAIVTGVKCKDSPDPTHSGHHLVLKGTTVPRIQNTHNVIDANLLNAALKELTQQENYRPLTFQEQLAQVLDKYDLSDEMEYLVPPVGIALTSEECFLLKKIMVQLQKTPYRADMPTQIQLMRLFQASDVAAEIISSYKPALDIMVWGNDRAEYKKGMTFLKKRLDTLGERSIAPDPRLQGTGSYINKNLADSILKRLNHYRDNLPKVGPGMFDISCAASARQHGLLSGVTVSDLDLSHAIPMIHA